MKTFFQNISENISNCSNSIHSIGFNFDVTYKEKNGIHFKDI